MERHSLLSLIENTDPGIVLFDDRFAVHYINRAFLMIFAGVTGDDVFSGDIMRFHDEAGRERIRQMFRLMKDSSRQVPFSFKRIGDGREDRYLFLKLIPLMDRGMADAMNCMLVYDITPFVADRERTFIKIPVSAGREIHLLDPDEVLFLRADNIYSRVHTPEGEYFCDFSLGFVEERLPPDRFYRIHRSYIANLARVRKVVRGSSGYTLLMRGSDQPLPVSRARAPELFTRLGLR